jgi:hypothetical protein
VKMLAWVGWARRRRLIRMSLRMLWVWGIELQTFAGLECLTIEWGKGESSSRGLKHFRGVLGLDGKGIPRLKLLTSRNLYINNYSTLQ